MKMLSGLGIEYAASARRLVDAVKLHEDPYRAGSSDALLAVVAARDSHRIAVSLKKNKRMPGFLTSFIHQHLSDFDSKHPHLKAARDVIQHADEYVKSEGRDKNQYFDIAKRFEEDEFHLRIGSNLDVDMLKLVDDLHVLAYAVDKAVNAWLGIEMRFLKVNAFAKSLVEEGFSAEIEIIENGTILDIVKISANQSDPSVSVSIKL